MNKHKPVIVGVSGGSDSLCLFDLFVQSGFQVVIASFNHGIRPEAEAETRVVAALGSDLGVPVVLGSGSVLVYAMKHQQTLEESARILRYRFLFNQAEIHQAQAVAVGHHADDQVETILMHLLRGTGLRGLSGMPFRSLPNPWSNSIPLVRPLLKVWRDEIDEYILDRKLEPVQDRTNLDTYYLRNRLRHEVIPQMDQIVPGFKQRLWQTAELLRADQELIFGLTKQVWSSLIAERGKGYIAICLEVLKSQPIGLQRRLVRNVVQELTPTSVTTDYSLVERVLKFCTETGKSQQMDVGLGLLAFLEEGKCFFASREAELPMDNWPQMDGELQVEVPGAVVLGSNWELLIEQPVHIPSMQDSTVKNQDPNTVWINLGTTDTAVIVRGRKPGDRFHPLGMEGKSMKISEYMINEKIPRRARDFWPLVCVDNEIAWVAGYQISHLFRLRGENDVVFRLTLRNKD